MTEPRWTPDMFRKPVNYQPEPVRSGVRGCEKCGTTISANKRQCRACSEAENKALAGQGSLKVEKPLLIPIETISLEEFRDKYPDAVPQPTELAPWVGTPTPEQRSDMDREWEAAHGRLS